MAARLGLYDDRVSVPSLSGSAVGNSYTSARSPVTAVPPAVIGQHRADDPRAGRPAT
jgi:hypothetical protein